MRGNTLIKRGEQLGVCKNEYKRDSLENEALAVISGIIKAYDLHESLNIKVKKR